MTASVRLGSLLALAAMAAAVPTISPSGSINNEVNDLAHHDDRRQVSRTTCYNGWPYKVVQGDTCYGLARAAGADVSTLYAEVGECGTSMQIGSSICVPAGFQADKALCVDDDLLQNFNAKDVKVYRSEYDLEPAYYMKEVTDKYSTPYGAYWKSSGQVVNGRVHAEMMSKGEPQLSGWLELYKQNVGYKKLFVKKC